MHRSRWLVALAFVLAVSGCGAPPKLSEWTPPKPLPLVHIDPGETIAVLFKSGTGPDGPLPVNQEAQRALETCIKDGLRKMKSTLVLSDLNHSQVRYRIDLEVHTTLGAGTPVGGGALLIGIERNRQTNFEADVHDVKHGQAVGRIVAVASGTEGSGIGLVPIPVPVIGVASTEGAACQHFGELLARRFTSGSGRLEDRSSTFTSTINHVGRWEYTEEMQEQDLRMIQPHATPGN